MTKDSIKPIGYSGQVVFESTHPLDGKVYEFPICESPTPSRLILWDTERHPTKVEDEDQ